MFEPRNRRIGYWLALAMVGACAATDPSAYDDAVKRTQGHEISRVGFFYRGGEDLPHPSTGIFGDIPDTIRAHQVAVLSLHPTGTAKPTPVVILPGFGIAVETFLQTPDGRSGWALELVRQGYVVYLVEPSHTTRSGINSALYSGQDQPTKSGDLFTWGREHVWSRWGLGPEYGVPAQDGRFPVEYYDQVVASFTAIETDVVDGPHQIGYQLESNVVGISSLLEEIGRSILLTHSASGVAAFAVASRTPRWVRAIVAIEPVGCPADNDVSFDSVPVLAVFGDHMEWRPQMPVRKDQCQAVVDRLRARQRPAAMFDLPAMGINGNSHLLYLEDNNAEIIQMILDWIAELRDE